VPVNIVPSWNDIGRRAPRQIQQQGQRLAFKQARIEMLVCLLERSPHSNRGTVVLRFFSLPLGFWSGARLIALHPIVLGQNLKERVCCCERAVSHATCDLIDLCYWPLSELQPNSPDAVRVFTLSH
jgi:hypothetical protein